MATTCAPARSPASRRAQRFAEDGGPVVGICNGFQVLAESHLLPGAFQKNAGLKFVARRMMRVETTESVLTSHARVGDVLDIPINHFEGNYTCSPETLAEFRGVSSCATSTIRMARSTTSQASATTGGTWWASCRIPERACNPLLGSTDGVVMMSSMWLPPARSVRPATELRPLRLTGAAGHPAASAPRPQRPPLTRHAAYLMPLRSP